MDFSQCFCIIEKIGSEENGFYGNFRKKNNGIGLARKKSQDNLAEIYEMITHEISLIETSNRFSRIDTLEKISNAFSVTVYDLFDFTECDMNLEDMQNSITKTSKAIRNDKVKIIALYNFLKNLINM